MEDIATWLKKQLDEDERGALEACDRDSGEWFVGRKWNVYREEDTAPYEDQDEHDLVVYGNVLSQSEHIARHDPARVLREVAAKRAIIADYQLVMANKMIEAATQPDEAKDAARDLIAKTLLMVLRRMAAPYADRDGYDPAWRVE